MSQPDDSPVGTALASLLETAEQLAATQPATEAEGPVGALVRAVSTVALATQLVRDPDAVALFGDEPAATVAASLEWCFGLLSPAVDAILALADG